MPLSACVVVPTNTHWDQRRSLARYDTDGINAPVSLPELEDGTDTGFSASDFLTLHSGLIVSGKYIDDDFRAKLATSRESDDDQLALGFSVPIAEGGAEFGSCAPVTGDGYFLTAAHVLSHEESYILYATSSRKQTFIDYAVCRVVYRNDDADFAIVKANLSTPRYLRFREKELAPGEVLFSGGWMHEKGGGVFIEEVPATGSGDERFRKIVTSLPMIKGDSGSPMIDRNGNLCGVLSTMRLGVVVKLKPRSTAVMMKPSLVRDLIRRDRMRH